MAFIETKSNQVIIDQAIASGDYISLKNGYVPFYGSEFELTYSGSQLYIGSGMLIQDGVKVINNEPIVVDVGSTSSGTAEYKIYLSIDMSNPENISTKTSLSTVTLPSDDLFSLFDNGIANVEVGSFTLGTVGIVGVKKTINKARLKTTVDIIANNISTKTYTVNNFKDYTLLKIIWSPSSQTLGLSRIIEIPTDEINTSREFGDFLWASENYYCNIKISLSSIGLLTLSITRKNGFPDGDITMRKIYGVK